MMIRPFLIALQFLTRFPIPLHNPPTRHETGFSLLFYPLVGLLIGTFLLLFSQLLLVLPQIMAAALLLTVWIFITGALHLDGLADSVDAWAGGHGEKQRTLAIMKDPCNGSMGLVSVVLLLIVKFSALAALYQQGINSVILLAPLLGRSIIPLLFVTTPYVRNEGLGTALSDNAPKKRILIILGLISTVTILIYGLTGLILLTIVCGLFFILRHAMMCRIGGTTGDTTGALVEMTETVVLISLVIINIHG